jgi:Apea-like HEPN
VWRYCTECLRFFQRALAEGGRVPTTSRQRVQLHADGSGLIGTYVELPSWGMLAAFNDETLRKLQVYESAVRALRADPLVGSHLGQRVGGGGSWHTPEEGAILRALLVDLLNAQEGITFSQHQFDQIYEGAEQYFSNSVLQYRCVTSLDGLTSEQDRIELAPNLAIIRFSEREIEDTLSNDMDRGFSFGRPGAIHLFGLECLVDVAKSIGEPPPQSFGDITYQRAGAQFDRACSALRLFKTGAVSYTAIRVQPMSWHPSAGVSTTASIYARLAVGPAYTLSAEEVPALRELWELVQATRLGAERRLSTAMNRFNFGYERPRPEDKLTDFLIGFEALLLKKNERQELEYRLALRGSRLVGKGEDERSQVFDLLKAAYSQRSTIVHGGIPKATVTVAGEQIPFHSFVDRVEDLLRHAIRAFLEQGRELSESTIINRLDRSIVTGS